MNPFSDTARLECVVRNDEKERERERECVCVEGRKIKIRKNDRDNEDSIESGVLGNIASM